MPDYGDILRFLATNPPQASAERDLNASLLELLAKCLREDDHISLLGPQDDMSLGIAASHERYVHFG
jgi:hypothetical protein